MMDWIKNGIEKMVPRPDFEAQSKVEKVDLPVKGAARFASPWR